MIWSRHTHGNVLRSTLREFYPAALVAVGDDLCGRDALAVLAKAPTPEAGRALSRSQLVAVLRGAGRRRYLETRVGEIRQALRSEQLPAGASAEQCLRGERGRHRRHHRRDQHPALPSKSN